MSSQHAHIIINPAAGAGKSGKVWPHVLDILKDIGMRFEHAVTEAPGHAVHLARSAVERGYETVVSVGGDGTINEVVNGMHESGGLDRTTLGIVNTGTGSDYIRTVGVPRHYKDACQRFVEPRQQTVDLGVVEYGTNGTTTRRLFANFAGMGFDAEMVRRITQQYKSFGTKPAYLMGVFSSLVTYRNKDVILKLDGQEQKRRVCTVVMNNGRYGGGGMNTAPNASLDDGLFDVLIIGDLGKLDFIKSLPLIYKGTHLSHPKVELVQAREIDISPLDGEMHLQADGELLGQIPARFTMMPGALKIIV